MNSFWLAIITIPLASLVIGVVYLLQYKVKPFLRFYLVIIHFLAVVAIITVYFYLCYKYYEPTMWQYSGGIIFIIGSFIFLYSAFVHSASLVPKENYSVVARGPYRYVRHPIYAGGILGAFGLIGVAPASEVFIIWCILLMTLLILLLIEERELNLRFGESYRKYCNNTKRLFPGIF